MATMSRSIDGIKLTDPDLNPSLTPAQIRQRDLALLAYSHYEKDYALKET